MKHTQLLLFLIFYNLQLGTINKKTSCEYTQLSKNVAQQWLNEQIKEISEDQLCNILYALFLTHHLIQCSLDMTIYKLTLQEESLSLYSPSITDSLHAPVKMKQNNFKGMYKTLRLLEETQQKLQGVYKHMEIIGSQIVALPTSITQTFINNIKIVLVAWSRNEKDSLSSFIHKIQSLKTIKKDLSFVESYYHEMVTAKNLDHPAIKHFASTLSKGYHNLENLFSSLIGVNKNRASKLKQVFTLTFKDHFTLLYKKLSKKEKENFQSEINNLDIGMIDESFIS